MEQMELRLAEQLKALTDKLSSFDGLKEHLEELDQRVSQRLDQVQTKMDLSLVSLGQVQQDQAQVGKALQNAAPAPPISDVLPPGPAKLGGAGLLGLPQGGTLHQNGPRLETAKGFLTSASPSSSSAQAAHKVPVEMINLEMGPQSAERGERGHVTHRGMPRMDFPKFDGTDARIWIDTCNTYFHLYQIPEGFKVSAASMNLVDNAAHWYQAYKLDNVWHTWEQFQQAVLSEFEVNVYRDRMRDLLQLKQTSTVEEYTKQFNQLVYSIRLYDASVGGMMLVTQFILGLKEELQGPVEAQLPMSVSMASTYAAIHEAVFERQKKSSKTPATRTQPYVPFRRDTRQPANSSEMWKAQQLKEYRRANNLCFKGGDKFAPDHQCVQPAAQLKALEGIDNTELISDAMLTAITELDNVNLGMFNLPHNVIPRLPCFDDVRLRQMILQCTKGGSGHPDYSLTTVRDPSQICYMRSVWDTTPDHKQNTERPPMSRRTPAVSLPASTTQSPTADAPPNSNTAVVPGASEFSNHIRDNYPLLAASPLGILLKQNNAIGFNQANILKKYQLENNIKFLQKMVDILGENCVCCSIRGLNCIAQQPQGSQPPALSNLYRTSPAASESEGDSSTSLHVHHMNQSSHDVVSSTQIHQNKKQKKAADYGFVTPTNSKIPFPQASPDDQIKNWADGVVGGIMLFTDDAELPDDIIVFGQMSPFKPDARDVKHTSYAHDHWFTGRFHPNLPHSVGHHHPSLVLTCIFFP
ncbi:hypothetical protein ACQ4PT_053818 [Festuca glaucescens]